MGRHRKSKKKPEVIYNLRKHMKSINMLVKQLLYLNKNIKKC